MLLSTLLESKWMAARNNIEELSKTSDTPDAHERYADSFLKDATIVMASKKAISRDGTY